MLKRVIKYVVFYLFFFALGITIGLYKNYRKETFREFQITGSIKEEYSDYTRSKIYVIVNVKDFNVDEMMEKIRQEHIRVNGEPDLLEINIYLSKKDMQCETEDKTYATKTFYKEE